MDQSKVRRGVCPRVLGFVPDCRLSYWIMNYFSNRVILSRVKLCLMIRVDNRRVVDDGSERIA